MKRPHIILDTNVLISALLFGGPPQEILGMVIKGSVACSLSSALVDELRLVLQRPKFGFSSQQTMAIAEELCSLCTIVSPDKKVAIIDADPDDNRVLECAIKAQADFIVSGDTHLLRLGSYEQIRIVSPSEFLSSIRTSTRRTKNGRKRS